MHVASPLPTYSLIPFDELDLPLTSQVAAVAASESLLYPKILKSLLAHAVRGERIVVIVGNNSLDVRDLARLARRQGLDPRPLLSRIDVSRAETCHQLHQCIVVLSIKNLMQWHTLYVIGFLDNFYDETPKYKEAKWLLHETLKRLKEIAESGLPVLLTLSAPKQSGREAFMNIVAQSVNAYRELSAPTPQITAPQQLGLPMHTG